MNVAFVQYAEHDVNARERGDNERGSVGQRGLVGTRGALEAATDINRHRELEFGFSNRGHSRAERNTGGEIEGNRDRRELPLVVDRNWHGARRVMRQRAQWYLL